MRFPVGGECDLGSASCLATQSPWTLGFSFATLRRSLLAQQLVMLPGKDEAPALKTVSLSATEHESEIALGGGT